MLKTLTLVCGVFAVSATVALAAPQKKPQPSGPNCKPKVTVILKGTIPTAPGGGATLPFGLAVTVMHTNFFGHAYLKATQPVTVTIDTKTRIRFEGMKGLTALQAMAMNDRVKLEARVCKADLANGATPSLTAKRLVAHTPAS